MNRRLQLRIVAGEHTCRDGAEGPWCRYVQPSVFVGHALCNLFGKTLPEVTADGKPSDGPAWLGRLPECKAAERLAMEDSR